MTKTTQRQKQAAKEKAKTACHRVCAWLKIASREKLLKTGEAVFVQSAQTVAAYREKACWYGGTVSGQTIYSYVNGNPLGSFDPFGLCIIIVGKGTLTFYNDAGMLTGTFPYSSGMHGNTNYQQGGQGPTPPGFYTVNPAEISPAGWFRKYIDPRDWGDFRAPLHPDPGTNVYGRDGFFIHGGKLRHGSEGCVKVEGPNQDDLFTDLKGCTGPVQVLVM